MTKCMRHNARVVDGVCCWCSMAGLKPIEVEANVGDPNDINWGEMGIKRTHSSHSLHGIRLHDYQEGVDFIRTLVHRRSGHWCDEAMLDPEGECWRFKSNERHDVVFTVPHTLVLNAQFAIDYIENNKRGRDALSQQSGS